MARSEERATHRIEPVQWGGLMAHRQGNRPTIGLFLTWLRSRYENELLNGVAQAAEALDLNLLCFVGREIRPPASPGAVIYELATPERLDGLIISGTLGHGAGEWLMTEFCRRYAPLPVVGIALQVQDTPTILPDSFPGMYQAVQHLVAEHGYRRVAFIRGPLGQIEAESRYDAYATVLNEYDLPIDEDLVVQGDYTSQSGRAATLSLLERGVDFDAIVAANDDMAVAALRVLEERGLRVPDDVALVGFDDVEAVKHISAPLTTVKQSFEALSTTATETLVQLMQGEAVPQQILVPTELVVRRSCGCFPATVDSARLDEAELVPADQVPEDLHTLARPDIVPEMIWAAFIGDVLTETSGEFLNVCDAALRRLHPQQRTLASHEANIRLETWQQIVSALRMETLPYIADRVWALRAENLLQQARVIVCESMQRAEGYRRLLVEEREVALEAFAVAMSSAITVEELGPVVLQHFPDFGFDYGYVTLYEDPDNPSDQVSVLLTYEQGEVVVATEDTKLTFPAVQVLPAQMLSNDRQAMVVLPLVLRDRQIGYAVLDLGPSDGEIYDRMSEQFSSTLFRIILIRQQAAAQRQAEAARRASEDTLRDMLVLQRRVTREEWAAEGRLVEGYVVSEELDAPSDTAWMPAMAASVELESPVLEGDDGGGSSLAVPIVLYDEIIGVMGFEQAAITDDMAQSAWTEQELATVESIVAQVALALENQRLLAEVERRAARLSAAAEISRAATSILSLDELLPRAVDLIRERFDLYYAGIFLVDNTQRWAVLMAGTGEAGQEMLARGHRLEVGGASMIGNCVAQAEAQITFDTELDRMHKPNPLLPDTRSELALPLYSRGQVIGAMTIQDTRANAFTEEDITTLQTMADQLGNAIENARLLQRMEQSMRELEIASGRYTREAWQAFKESAARPLGYRYRLTGVEPAREQNAEARAALQARNSVVKPLAAQEGAESHARSALAVPIRLRDEVVGVLNLRFEDEVVPQETVDMMEQIANRLAISLETARLLEDTRQQAEREQVVSDVTARVRETLDVETVLQRAVQELRGMLDLAHVEIRMGAAPEAEAVPEE